MNVRNLLVKEMKLVLLPPSLLFVLLAGGMLFIPTYPFLIGFVYILFPVQLCFQIARENKDLEFTMSLPVTREDIIKSKQLLVIFMELIYLVVGAVCGIVRLSIDFYATHFPANTFLDINFTLFGVIIIGFAIFNLVFFPLHFKTGVKLLKALLWGVGAMLITFTIFEGVNALVPTFHKIFDGTASENLWVRLTFLIFSIIIYILANLLSLRLSCKNFKNVGI